MRFRHYKNSDSMGAWYLFGFNIYRDLLTNGWTIDLIIGKHLFSVMKGK